MTLTTAEVWENFSKQLQWFISSRVNQPQDTEDLLQDVFVKIHTRLPTLREEERLVSWIYQIARNTIIDYYRGSKQVETLPESISVDPEPLEADPEARIAAGLNELIIQLPEKYQEALLFTEIQGYKQTELAHQLGISVSGAKSRVQRGRLLLREELFACCHFEFDRLGKIIDYTPHPDYCENCQS